MKKYKYLIELGSALILYLVVLVFSLRYLKKDNLDNTVQIFITVLPVIPCLLVVWSVLRQISRLDELQKHIQLFALAFAFTGTALLTFSYGFLENIGFPSFSMFIVWPIMAFLWGIGVVVGCLRYR
ncbi:hypothetical protein [Acinetobacter sp. XS-4]|uniref:hypothetical protein n=1 Tax=Acinetobacter sp. XS-4 TaxID=2923375 RepID=UPI00208E53DD|nr:hypothetical protein [Acinetobacter sp. XS-4]USP42213.1 hypothetical protein MMY79_09185 [Acinetobacter sp. XS-4]